MLLIDTRRAYMHAPETRDIFIELPAEDGSPGMRGKLNKSMYSTRGAAQSWGIHYSSILQELGFVQGKHPFVVFFARQGIYALWFMETILRR